MTAELPESSAPEERPEAPVNDWFLPNAATPTWGPESHQEPGPRSTPAPAGTAGLRLLGVAPDRLGDVPQLDRAIAAGRGEQPAVGAEGHVPDLAGVFLKRGQKGPP